jgi:hypothetical protein
MCTIHNSIHIKLIFRFQPHIYLVAKENLPFTQTTCFKYFFVKWTNGWLIRGDPFEIPSHSLNVKPHTSLFAEMSPFSWLQCPCQQITGTACARFKWQLQSMSENCIIILPDCFTTDFQIVSIICAHSVLCVTIQRIQILLKCGVKFYSSFATCNTTETHFNNLVLMSSPGSQSQCKASVYTSTDADLMLHCIHSSTVLQLKASILHEHKKKLNTLCFLLWT